MQFHKSGSLYKVVRISGPTHNFLGLEFDDGECEPIVEQLTLNAGEPQRLDGDEIRNAVMNGMAEANRKLGTNLQVRRIQFVVSDSPPSKIYEELAQQIVMRARTCSGEFNGSV